MSEQPASATETTATEVVQPTAYVRTPIGAAVVWAAIVAIGRRRLEPATQADLEKFCAGWWMGFTAASIARLGAAPPQPLTPTREKVLQYGSLALVTLGLGNAARLLWSRGSM